MHSLRTSGLPNHSVKLKVGTPIMLLKNLDQVEGLCNGTRLVVTRLGKHVHEARVITIRKYTFNIGCKTDVESIDVECIVVNIG